MANCQTKAPSGLSNGPQATKIYRINSLRCLKFSLMCKNLSSDCKMNTYISRGYGERNWTTKTSFFIIKIMYFVYVTIEACLHIGLGVPINFANTSIAIHPNFKMIYRHAFEHGIENKEVLIENQICNILLMRFESNLFAQVSQFCDTTFS